MARNLVRLSTSPKVAVTRGAARDFLRHALDLLPDSLDFLFGCLPAERCHSLSSLQIPSKQETFPLDFVWLRHVARGKPLDSVQLRHVARGKPLDNPRPVISRLISQET